MWYDEPMIKYLRCPICGLDLNEDENAYVCEKHHTFNVSKKGTINFVNTTRSGPYDLDFFIQRQHVLTQGFFSELVDIITGFIDKHQPKPRVIVDMGSGEGTFTKEVKNHYKHALVYGIDYSKYGVQVAAKGVSTGVHFLVGDIANIPLQKASVSVLLNIFSPANYGEFMRVLKDDGILIKVVPLQEHFKEISQNHKTNDNAPLTLMMEHFNIIDEVEYKDTLQVEAKMVDAIQKMSPHYFNQDKHYDIDAITIHCKVVVARV